jgi:hypothetical protein
MPIPFDFDFRNPDYTSVFKYRMDRLTKLRLMPDMMSAMKVYYRDHIAQFIIDWGVTSDPRNVELGLPAVLPFLLFPKQEEWIEWVIQNWRDRKPGLTEKSRDCGLSWVSVAFACSMCIFNRGMAVGFGSRKAEYVDLVGAPKSLFWRARAFMSNLPPEFRAGWDERRHAPYMRMIFPHTGSTMSGESGDGIGRGDRSSIFFVDEAAHLEHPQLTEASLSMTTNCRQDVSTPNGMSNPFAEKRFGGKIRVFTFWWRDDPRKDQAWYDAKESELDPVTFAQEVNLDYAASVEGVLIPSAWIQSAIDAHIKLAFVPTGRRAAALDVADEGKDTNALCGAHGVVIQRVDEWSGKNSDILRTVYRAFGICDEESYDDMTYDADGLGASVRGDSTMINAGRDRKINIRAFRGSAKVMNPLKQDVRGRRNEDFFANYKAQSWWSLRMRFQATHRAVQAKLRGERPTFDPDDLIAISSSIPLLARLVGELSQPTYSVNVSGKILVDKKPDGTKSPNLADSVMIRFANARGSMTISDEALARSMAMTS